MTHINETLFVGLGAVGSQLIGPVAALLHNDPNCWGPPDAKGEPTQPKITVVDGDKYEEKNLKNQCITKQDVGQNKAEVAATMISGLVEAEAWPKYIKGPLEIQSFLVSARTAQQKRIDAGLFGGVVLIVTSVDNPHFRRDLYAALDEVPNVSVLVIDPSNGAGADAHIVDVATYLRIYDGKEVIEPWISPVLKFANLKDVKGVPDWAAADCMEKAVTEPQLRTSNMMAATLAYDCLVAWLNESGMVEGYHADIKTWQVGQVGVRMPTHDEMKETADTVTVEE